MELVDPRLGSDFNKEEVVRLIKVALLCTNPSPALRLTMSAVLRHTIVPELIMDPSIYGDQLRLAAVRQHLDEIVQQGQSEESQSLVPSSRINSSATSTSQDLYQIVLIILNLHHDESKSRHAEGSKRFFKHHAF
ncbi:hypothetical protein FEM48_Zijuj01G0051200 [Ziziphus jujuba var. spinosa]|uniref:Uncharacterized protein n=1 Tax=Ziziphus jujuba var. spinosa TaxID=714518 RepID=A0A978VZA6_ZIZJJ|nr:hypothetical protein FEM48_Zijuj01G0051200 [Ziziphus jujuba var. spinosa]